MYFFLQFSALFACKKHVRLFADEIRGIYDQPGSGTLNGMPDSELQVLWRGSEEGVI